MATAATQPSSTTLSKMTTTTQSDRNVNLECVTIALLDVRRESTSVFVGALRAINDYVRTFTETDGFPHYGQSSREAMFVILTSSSDDLLSAVQLCPNVEAIFILDPSGTPIRGDLPKVIGVYTQQEELVRAVRMTLETFEQVQLETFAFETEKIFLWWQLWKEEVKERFYLFKNHRRMFRYV